MYCQLVIVNRAQVNSDIPNDTDDTLESLQVQEPSYTSTEIIEKQSKLHASCESYNTDVESEYTKHVITKHRGKPCQ
jgi:hypothetical protein